MEQLRIQLTSVNSKPHYSNWTRIVSYGGECRKQYAFDIAKITKVVKHSKIVGLSYIACLPSWLRHWSPLPLWRSAQSWWSRDEPRWFRCPHGQSPFHLNDSMDECLHQMPAWTRTRGRWKSQRRTTSEEPLNECSRKDYSRLNDYWNGQRHKVTGHDLRLRRPWQVRSGWPLIDSRSKLEAHNLHQYICCTSA